jgi:hypothetical protein
MHEKTGFVNEGKVGALSLGFFLYAASRARSNDG